MSSEPGEAHHVRLGPPCGSTCGERVTHESRGTRADGSVVPGLALSVLSAGLIAGGAAVVVIAGSIKRALAVVDALTPGATDQGISPVAGRTGAHWPVSS